MSLDTRYLFHAEVVRWIDGDTVDLLIDLGFKISTEQRVRLLGVNAPERGEPGHTTAIQLCNTLAPNGSKVLVATYKDRREKYGRLLAEVSVQLSDPKSMIMPATVNAALLERGLAAPYGQTRA